MKKHGKKWKRRLKIGAFLLPSLGGVSVFYLVPFLVVIVYAMVDNPIGMNFVFLENLNIFCLKTANTIPN